MHGSGLLQEWLRYDGWNDEKMLQIQTMLLTKNNPSYIFRNMSNCLNTNVAKFAEMFKALSNPNRLKIFLRLISCCQPGTRSEIKTFINCGIESKGCACVGELGEDLGIVPSTISHHIKELRQAGLIRMERRGQKMECWIDPDAIKDLKDFFS